MADTHPEGKKRYLAAGGLGYVGCWITEHLAALGHTVFVLSRRAEAPPLASPYTLVTADLALQKPEELASLLPERLDGVVQAAGYNHSAAPDQAEQSLLVNALGTRNLLQALLAATPSSRSLPAFLYCSTIHVYGAQGEPGTVRSLTEETPPAPQNDYALTHWFAEEYCRMFHREHGLPAVCLRLSNGFGTPKLPGAASSRLLVNDLCRQAVEQGRIVLRSDPRTSRDFLWLGIVAAAVERLFALHPSLVAGRTYNLASGQSVSIGDIARRVARCASALLGKEIPVMAPPTENVPPPPAAHVDPAALSRTLGPALDLSLPCLDGEIETAIRRMHAMQHPLSCF